VADTNSVFNTLASWLFVSTELAMLGVEAQMVIGQQWLMLGSPKTCKEAERMVIEKVKDAAQAVATIAMGGTPHKVVRSYSRKVPANHRQLSKC
jgi:hypothetical protein